MNIINHFSLLSTTQDILSKDKIKVRGASDGYNQMLILSDFYSSDKSIFVVLPNIYLAQQYYDNLIKYINEDDVLFFPADELISAEMVSSTGDFLFERIQTLYTLLSNEKKIVVMNMHAAIKYEMPKEKWIKNIFRVNVNDEIKIEDICNKLVLLGYEKTFTTSKTGEFSRRGSIVDIFPLGYENPIRIDFFGDDVDTIKEFDVMTQRSKEKLSFVDVLPVSEFLYDNKEFNFAKDKINAYFSDYNLSQIEADNVKSDLFKLENHNELDSLSRYMSFFEEELNTIFDFKDNKRIYLIDPIKSNELFNTLELDLNEFANRMGGMSLLGMKHYKSFLKIELNSNVEIEGVRSFSSADLDVFAKEVLPYNANPKKIMDDFLKIKKDNLLIVYIKDDKRYQKLKSYLLENEVFCNEIDDILKAKVNFINLLHGDYPSFEMTLEKLIIINEETLFSTNYSPRRIRYKSIYKNAVKINKYDELNIGDYVVHYNYGIGKYLGIKTIKHKDNIERDYLHVVYANKSALFIPLEQISNIMKYASADVEGVKLNSLGTTEWARTKAKARKRIHDISDKLISLYSARAQAKGFACPLDTVEQLQFETEFDYELTPDQKKAVDAVKRDMESTRPMDRLICGDVGYGKTEVACRAAFKMVMSGGKQVLILAPTTILARQHYYTFKNRMEAYGMRVELLSRFVPLKAQKKIIEDTLKGSVDILIGTHKVLSDNIKFKDLGLLVIDEEQRFGVTHKEKIKELKVNIDCITLTATPIPRTLQMSVMGIKDLSMIETPPKNRYPIQTYVLERNDRIIADAISKELARGGQVFYLYNYTDSIEEMEIKLKSLVPHARICVGHGKLRKDQLENVISKFIDKEYDVLLCTTIIETGIDIPETNTLIIHDADRLGLSQMYQIRGRVGRSSKIAYAYLMYEPRKVLTEQAEKRLETIKEFNELGSGFKIAMRDLSIRGAGDILGEEQSGFIESIGIDMYMKLLDEEINKKEVIEEPKKLDPSLANPMVSRTIKKEYIDNDDARIYIHKRIDKLSNVYETNELIAELKDRFGEADNDLLLYIYEKLMDNYCKELDIYRIEEGRGYRSFIFTQEKSANLNGEKLFMLTNQYKNINLTQMNREVRIVLDIRGLEKLDQFKMICNYFNDYCLEQ